MFKSLSTVLLAIILIDFIIRVLKRDSKKTKKYFTYIFLTLGITLSLKLIFRIRRDYIDPFAFPSTHASLSIIPFFVYENPYYKVLWLIYASIIGALRVLGGFHTIPQVLFGYIFTGIGILLFNILEKELGKDLHRKSIHVGLGSLIGYILFINPLYGMFFSAFLLFIGAIFYVFRNTYFISMFLKEYSKSLNGKEAFTFVGGILITSIIGYMLNVNPYFTAFYLAWVDGLSTILGLYIGKHLKEKSIYGLFGGILGGIIAMIATRTNPILAFTIPLIEYKTRKLDDNLIIPLSTLLIYILLAQVSNMGLYYLSPQFPF